MGHLSKKGRAQKTTRRPLTAEPPAPLRIACSNRLPSRHLQRRQSLGRSAAKGRGARACGGRAIRRLTTGGSPPSGLRREIRTLALRILSPALYPAELFACALRAEMRDGRLTHARQETRRALEPNAAGHR